MTENNNSNNDNNDDNNTHGDNDRDNNGKGVVGQSLRDEGKTKMTMGGNTTAMTRTGDGEKEAAEKEEEMERGKESEDEEEVGLHDDIQIDKGFSWVICICVCFVQMLVFGHNRAISAWFVDIREEFQQSQTVTSLTLSVFALSLAVSSMLSSNVIIKLVPPRISCVAASVCSCVAVFAASQAPHIGLWLACYAVRGLACGVLLIIPMSLIGYYFKCRRGLASSIASMGMVIANITFPPLATALKQTFGVRGAMLLMVGVELQMIPLCMMLRPHSFYTRRHKNRGKQPKETPQEKGSALTKQISPNDKNKHVHNSELKYQQPVDNQYRQHERDVGKTDEEAAMELYFYSASAPAIANAHLDLDQDMTSYHPDSHLYKDLEYEANGNTENSDNDANSGKYTDQERFKNGSDFEEQRKPLLSPRRMLSVDEGSGLMNKKVDGQNSDVDDDKSFDDFQNKMSSPKDVRKRYQLHPEHSRTSHHSSKVNIAPLGSLVDVSFVMVDEKMKEKNDDRGSDDDNHDDDRGDEETNEKPTFSQVCQLKTFVDMTLFKLWLFRMVAVFMAFSGGTVLLIVYLPVLATEAGLTKDQGSWLLTIGGSVDLVVRPIIGWVADKKILSKELMVTGSMVVVAVLCQFGRFYTTFPLFVVFTVLACLFAGFRANLFHAIIFDYFGPERAPKVFGLALVCTTAFMAVNHPIFGALIDTTGSHVVPLHYVGAVLVFAALAFMFQSLFARLDRQNKEKEMREEEEEKKKKKNAELLSA